MSATLSDLKVALQDLSTELQEERQSSQELTQQFARAKASWEVERTELKSLITQVLVLIIKIVPLLRLNINRFKGLLVIELRVHPDILSSSLMAINKPDSLHSLVNIFITQR